RNERNAELLGEAAAFFRAALTVRAPERSLLDWYYSKDGLKEALTQQALLTPGTAEIEELRGALRELMDRYPPDWRRNGLAEYQADMADVLHELNLRGGDPALLKDSAAFFRMSLETAEENTHPSFFVSINRKLAAVLKRAAALSGDMDIYRQSAAASRAALTYIDAGNAEMRAFTQRDLGLVLSTLGDSGGDMNALEESIDVLSSAIDHFNADDYPAEWADLTNNIAWLNVLAGRHYGDIARFESAANDLKFVVAIQRDIGNTATLAFSEDSLCAALYEIGRARSEKPLLENAADACASAIEHFQANGMEDFADGSTKLLSQVEDAMAAAD
ncbi:MAG: hypothetical protein KDJ43_02565, partial [Rhizobiaceae bacterium]|nr:hypothetical protein [Rhizobiaceae bacterium]